MALVKFNNGKSLAPVYTPFNELFDSLFKDSLVDDRVLTNVPAVNISESDDKYDIELAAPGLKKEDFKINVENNVLTISAESKSEKKEENKKMTRQEFSYSSFTREFTLPETADTNKIVAKYKDGVLNIAISKKEEAKVQSREITVS